MTKNIKKCLEILRSVKCYYCKGTGRSTWHRRDVGECVFCSGTGVPEKIEQVMKLLKREKVKKAKKIGGDDKLLSEKELFNFLKRKSTLSECKCRSIAKNLAGTISKNTSLEVILFINQAIETRREERLKAQGGKI